MKQHMAVATAVVLGAIGFLAVPSRALASGTGTTSRDQGDISLQIQDGACGIVATSRIQVKRGAAVRWRVTNGCGREYAVRVTGFRRGTTPVDPLGCPTAERERRVRNGQTATLVCAVRGNSEEGVYAYDIALDGQVVTDPELEIER